MSTKIYAAYRLKDGARLWPLVRRVHRAARKAVVARLRELITGMMGAVDVESDAYKSQLASWKNERIARLHVAGRGLATMYKQQATSPYRNEFNFDVAVSLREHEGAVYLIPHCDMLMRDVLDFLRQDPELEDFAYWNNADEPESVSAEEWRERGRIWDAMDIVEDGHRCWHDVLLLEVCAQDRYYQLDPTVDMHREIYQQQAPTEQQVKAHVMARMQELAAAKPSDLVDLESGEQVNFGDVCPPENES